MVLIRAKQLIGWSQRWFLLAKGSTPQNAPSHCVSIAFYYSVGARERSERLLTTLLSHVICDMCTGHVANLLVRFALASDKVVPVGWAPRTLIQCGVAYAEIWDILHGMYESQVTFIPLQPPLFSFRSISPLSFFEFGSQLPVK